jgi:hypothetical protein
MIKRHTSFQPPNEGHQIEPLEFIKFKESEFYSNLIKQNNCSQELANQLYKVVNELIMRLKETRADSIRTDGVIESQIKALNFENNWILVENWLIRAIENNDTYKYANNYLAQDANRRARWAIHKLNPTTEIELFKLLENEKMQGKMHSSQDQNEKLIAFNKPETVDLFYDILKGYFSDHETDLKQALQGEKLKAHIVFPHNQNKFVEVFKRAKYNSYLLSTPIEIKNWLCSNFKFRYKKGKFTEIRNFNTSTVGDILTKDKGEPTKKERICTVDWLPYKNSSQLQREAENEKL